ncbi:hypothetical protein MASR1M32_32610 [Rhodobacter sp.]
MSDGVVMGPPGAVARGVRTFYGGKPRLRTGRLWRGVGASGGVFTLAKKEVSDLAQIGGNAVE